MRILAIKFCLNPFPRFLLIFPGYNARFFIFNAFNAYFVPLGSQAIALPL
jgi:hypothetical protein